MNENNAPNIPAPKPIDTAKLIRTGWWMIVGSIVITVIPLYFGYVHLLGILFAALSLRAGVTVKNIPLIIVSSLFIAGGLLLYFLTPKV